MKRGLTLVISLEERDDRRKHILENLNRVRHDFLFIDANRPSDMPINMQSSAIAIWSSHVLALETFLLTDSDFTLVLEDDVYLENALADKVIASLDCLGRLLQEDFSIMQLGTMNFVSQNSFRAMMSRIYFMIFGYHRYDKNDLIRLKKYLGLDKFKRLRLALTNCLDMSCSPLFGFNIGAQAYIINRNGAQEIVQDFKARTDWDLESIYGIDTWLADLSHSYDLKPRCFRTSIQLLVQRKTQSDNIHRRL